MFVSPYYAEALWKICKSRDLNVNTQLNLIRVDPLVRNAYFERITGDNIDSSKQQITSIDGSIVCLNYDMLHVTPPMSAAKFLSPLSTRNSNGFVAVNNQTLQHVKYRNIFSLGDCSSLPTSKTAAAIAAQNYVLANNLSIEMGIDNNNNDQRSQKFLHYNGYTSCPLLVGFNRCILAEFDYTLQPVETWWFDQRVPRFSTFFMNTDLFPALYWRALLNGRWPGPEMSNIRRWLNPKKNQNFGS